MLYAKYIFWNICLGRIFYVLTLCNLWEIQKMCFPVWKRWVKENNLLSSQRTDHYTMQNLPALNPWFNTGMFCIVFWSWHISHLLPLPHLCANISHLPFPLSLHQLSNTQNLQMLKEKEILNLIALLWVNKKFWKIRSSDENSHKTNHFSKGCFAKKSENQQKNAIKFLLL